MIGDPKLGNWKDSTGSQGDISYEPKPPDSDIKEEDEKKATEYFESRLKGERLIEIPQADNCRVGIVVPSYNETPERILAQIESLVAQEGLLPENFEVIYVVNNGIEEKSDIIVNRNQAVLDLPIWKNRNNRERLNDFPEEQRKRLDEIQKRFNLFVVDKSSRGQEIKDCNVGKARNRGVAEEGQRFHGAHKNGILVQTDADTRFLDKEYLKKVIDTFDGDPNLIAAAGGLKYEFSPVEQDKTEEEQRKHYEDLKKLKSIKRFTQFVWKRDHPEVSSPGFNLGGGNMISRSFEAAVVSKDLGDLAAGEDTQFGRELEKHAIKRGKHVVEKRDELVLVSALRESSRTPVKYKTSSGKNEKGELLTEKPFSKRSELVTVEEAYAIAREEAMKTEDGKKLVEYEEGPGRLQYLPLEPINP